MRTAPASRREMSIIGLKVHPGIDALGVGKSCMRELTVTLAFKPIALPVRAALLVCGCGALSLLGGASGAACTAKPRAKL